MMLATATAAVALGVTTPTRRLTSVAVIGGSFLIHPLLGVIVAAVVLCASRFVTIQRRGRRERDSASDVLLALDLMALAATSGLPFSNAAATAARLVGGPTGESISWACRRLDAGLAHGLPDGLLGAAFDAAHRSAVTGASLAGSLADLAHRAREDEAAVVQERLEKLPVKLLFPLAFLILPGFVLVAVVPTIVSGLSQLTR